jgi:WD40 repeat protein
MGKDRNEFPEPYTRIGTDAESVAIHRIRIQQTLDQVPRLLRVFPHEIAPVCSAFSPDGRWMATGTREGLHLWNAASGAPLWPIKDMGGPVLQLRFSPDGRRLLASSTPEHLAFDGGMPSPPHTFYAVLEIPSGRLLWSSQEAGGVDPLHCSAFSSDGRWLAAGVGDAVEVYDLESGCEVVAALMTAANRLITVSSPDLLRAWDLKGTELPMELLQDYAQYLSGRRLHRNFMLNLDVQEMAALDRSLRARAPHLFE